MGVFCTTKVFNVYKVWQHFFPMRYAPGVVVKNSSEIAGQICFLLHFLQESSSFHLTVRTMLHFQLTLYEFLKLKKCWHVSHTYLWLVWYFHLCMPCVMSNQSEPLIISVSLIEKMLYPTPTASPLCSTWYLAGDRYPLTEWPGQSAPSLSFGSFSSRSSLVLHGPCDPEGFLITKMQERGGKEGWQALSSALLVSRHEWPTLQSPRVGPV